MLNRDRFTLKVQRRLVEIMQGMTSIGATDRQDHGDAIDSYFDCITSCDIDDGICVEQCVLVHLKQGDDAGG